MNIYKNILNIGFVCIDNLRLSPVAATIMRRLIIKSKKSNVRKIIVSGAGYKRVSNKTSNSAIGYLQTKGFNVPEMLSIKIVNKSWLERQNIIFTMDRFLKRDLLYDFYLVDSQKKEKSIKILNKAAGIEERIRDPGKDYSADIKPVYNLIEKCCKIILSKIEKEN